MVADTPCRPTRAALEGLRVVDVATLIAAPAAARYLADFGADVIKIERPDGGDPVRTMGWRQAGVSMWWKLLGRNKRTVSLDFKNAEDLKTVRALIERADVLIENFRPGTLERLGLDPAVLFETNPGLVILRVSGFGQDGPYRSRAGFGTLAEAMSGFTYINGLAGGPPILPPVALADEVAGLFGVMGVLMALRHRDRTGEGQVIDVSLLESLFSLLGPLPSVFAQLGEHAERMGSRIAYSAPRGTYPTKDGEWLALSGTSQSVAIRILRAIGRADLIDDPRFSTPAARVENVDEVDGMIADWSSARTLDECMEALLDADAAASPVYDIERLFRDPHVAARGMIAEIDDPELGGLRMQNVVPRLSVTPGRIRHAGRPPNADLDAVCRDWEVERPPKGP